MRRLALLACPLLVAVLAPLALAQEVGRVDLPRAGLSVEVPSGWTVDLYGDALLEAHRGDAGLWIRAFDAQGAREPGRHWQETEGGRARCTALVAREGRVVFEVEADVATADAAVRGEVDGMLDSLDLRPYAYPTRHVDARDGWTVTLPAGWTRVVSKERTPGFAGEGGASGLEVARLEDLMAAADGKPDTPRDLDAWTDLAWKEGLKRLQARRGTAAAGAPGIETVHRDGVEARRVRQGLDPDANGAPRGWMHVLVQDGWRVLGWGGSDADAVAVDSFVTARRPGPRLTTGTPHDTFPGEGGPPVVFALPEGWKLEAGANAMRRAQVRLPGLEAEGIVYYFGAGMGGGVDENLTRWRGQVSGDDEGRKEVFEPAPDVKLTTLEVVGAYSSSTMNPHGADPHHEGGGAHEGSRMFAAVLEVPEGPLFVKLVGPDEDVARVTDDLRTWLLSFRPAPR